MPQNLQGINSMGAAGKRALDADSPYVSDVVSAYNPCTAPIFNHLPLLRVPSAT